jgi:hypothetical protein
MFDVAIEIIWDDSSGRQYKNYVYLIFMPRLFYC